MNCVLRRVNGFVNTSIQLHKSRLLFENAATLRDLNTLKKFCPTIKRGEFCTASTPPPGDEVSDKKKKKKNKDDTPEIVDVRRLDFRIGQITSVKKHPDADLLYVEQVNIGESKPRTIVSGLVKYMQASELNDLNVVVLCNIKPTKMRGVTSEGMVMVASTPEKVELLVPPAGSSPGDKIKFEGYPRTPDTVLKKKILETCLPDLKTDDNCCATYKSVPFEVPGKGKVVAKTLANVPIK